MRTYRFVAIALVASIALGACQSGPVVTAPPATTAASAAATVAATIPPPSPTAPPDVAALFTVKAATLRSGVMQVEGTATVGLVQATFAGTTRFSGIDNESRLATTIGGVITDVQTIQTGGRRFSKTGEGPWLEVPVVSGGDLSSALSGSATARLTDAGTEDRGGRIVHRLVPATASGFDPAAILSSLAGAEGFQAKLAFFAAEDGAPVGASIEASWTQPQGDHQVNGTLTFDLTFSSLGTPQAITTPEHIWTSFTSSRYHYRFAYPDGWTFTKRKGYDSFDSSTAAYAGVTRTKSLGLSLSTIAKGELAYDKTYLRTKAGTNEPFTVGGVSARLLSLTGKPKGSSTKIVVYEIVVIKSGYVYFITWASEVGQQAIDKATFEEMVGTLAFT